jgi:signal transduction histidine kinase
MNPHESLDMRIAFARVVLSIVAIASIYVDPTVPNLTPWFALTGGFLAIDRYALAILCVHLSYSGALLLAARSGLATLRRPAVSKILDVLFAVVVAIFTEGATSPAYVFFTFAILAVACREGFRATAVVIAWTVGTYILLVLVSSAGASWTYLMRPVYLAITGSLIGFLGQQRVDFEARIRELEAAAERRGIARSLHDGYVQALAGVMLRLESSRELLRRAETPRALRELADLQQGVAREYDEVRRYIRSLVDEGPPSKRDVRSRETTVSLRTEFRASASVVEEVLQVLLEGTRNVICHASATSASLGAFAAEGAIRVTIDDDGVGFGNRMTPPWVIASRVRELGGDVRLSHEPGGGAHLRIEVPVERYS